MCSFIAVKLFVMLYWGVMPCMLTLQIKTSTPRSALVVTRQTVTSPQYFNIMTPLNCTKRGLYNETHVQNNYTSYLKHLRQSCMDNNLYSTCRRPMASHVILPLV